MNGRIDTVSLPSKDSRPPIAGQEDTIFYEFCSRVPESHEVSLLSDMESSEIKQNQMNDAKSTVDRNNISVSSETKIMNKDSTMQSQSNPSPPPPYKWAQSLQCLLDDMQGVELFQKFLKLEGQDTKCLDFLFACRGVKKTAKTIDSEKLLKLVQVLYDKKVNRINAISDETKREIKKKISSKVDVDVNIFDEAQRQVERNIISTTYPNFLQSEIYLMHLEASRRQFGADCLVSPAEPASLPTLHEDSELQFNEKCMSESWRRKASRPGLTQLNRIRTEPGPYLKSPYSSYHTKYGTFLPTSAQDSELQSLSSDAQTDDTMSLTDSSVDYSMSRHRQKRLQKKGNVYLNKDEFIDCNFIPRTQRIDCESVKAKNQLDPHQLIKKLNKLVEEQYAKESLDEKLKNVESNKPSKPTTQVFDTNFFMQQTEDNDQDILDKHVSRVFDDLGETPVLSPVCSSPPVSRPLCEAVDNPSPCVQDLSYTTQKGSFCSPFSVVSAPRHKREHDTRSNDSGAVIEWISDDNLAAGSKQNSLLNRGNREQSRRSCRRSSSVNDSASSCVDSGISEIFEPGLHSHSNSTQKAAHRSGEAIANIVHNFASTKSSRYTSMQLQPFAQDLSMSAPDTTSNLMETRRRLEDDMRIRGTKSRYVSNIAKARQSFRASDLPEDGISHRKQSKKSSPGTSETSNSTSDVTVIGYSYKQGDVPFVIRYPGKNVTLKNFKSLLCKKGNFKYYFKKVENAFGTGTVLEEVSDDYAVLPLWEGKVFCVLEAIDDVSTSTEEDKTL